MLATAVRPSKILPRSVWDRVLNQIRSTLGCLPDDHLRRAIGLLKVTEDIPEVTTTGCSREQRVGALQAVVGICANRVSGSGRPSDRQRRRVAEIRRVLEIIERA